MIGRTLIAAALLAAPAEAFAAALVVTTSTERIEITSNFTGGALTVFGAIEDERVLAGADIVVVLRGPDETVTTRRKERTLGLWLNRDGATFVDVASFYAIHSTRPLADIAEADILAGLKLGLASLVPVDDDFGAAFIRLRGEEGRFVEDGGGIERFGDTVFRTAFTLPADVPVGDFVVEAYLFGDGRVLDYATRSLAITKTGSEQFIHQASLDYPWLYALVVIAIAMGAGWLGGVIFRRD